jgi:hypothetical protein
MRVPPDFLDVEFDAAAEVDGLGFVVFGLAGFTGRQVVWRFLNSCLREARRWLPLAVRIHLSDSYVEVSVLLPETGLMCVLVGSGK